MAGLTHLTFDGTSRDLLINGKPLLSILARNEDVRADMYQLSIGCQPLARERLLAEAEPDLGTTHAAIYLCGMCGGYDGSPIGARVHVNDDAIRWTQLGHYDDVDDTLWPFKKVISFHFEPDAYRSALKQATR
ncbi:MAG: hypothetical protein AAFY08_00455 [Planctomycetota bacterium]